MASNKNQHFVPRCHLKPFTHNEGDKAISVFNVQREQLIELAPVRHQCAKDYFYGHDELLERAIQATEGGYGGTLKALRDPSLSISEGHHWLLRRFWLLQHLRTEAASHRMLAMAQDTDEIIGEPTLAREYGIKEVTRIAMQVHAEERHIIDDLKVCILRNATDTPFITSDDPAVALNRWYAEDARVVDRSPGLHASGMLAMLPLTPQLYFIAYDDDVYGITHECGRALVRRRQDIHALNQLQFLNCFANVYFHDPSLGQSVADQYSQCAAARPLERHAIHIAVPDGVYGNYMRYRIVSPDEAKSHPEALIHSESRMPRPTAWPSFLRWRTKGAVFTNGTGSKYVRRAHAATRFSSRPYWKEPAR